jgi:hypothetical protein
MYPARFFDLFPPHPENAEVFVAISFWDEFAPRTERVIKPAISDIGLKPRIVNASKISDSITAEICDGISKSRLVFVDLSISSKGHRNHNVMYEVGLAHAVRRPEEVVIFRDDDGPLPFDLSTIRVNRYDPNDVDTARRLVAHALTEASKEVDLRKSLAVRRARAALDHGALMVLQDAARTGFVEQPPLQSMGQILANSYTLNCIARLLESGLLCGDVARAKANLLIMPRYLITPLGHAVLEATTD